MSNAAFVFRERVSIEVTRTRVACESGQESGLIVLHFQKVLYKTIQSPQVQTGFRRIVSSLNSHHAREVRQGSLICTAFGRGNGGQAGLEKRGSQRHERLRGIRVEHLVYFVKSSHWSRDSLTAKPKQLLMNL